MMIVETMTSDSPVDALVDLVRGLVGYEARDRMVSTVCFAQYQAGKLSDAVEVVEWAGIDPQSAGLLQELSALARGWMTPHDPQIDTFPQRQYVGEVVIASYRPDLPGPLEEMQCVRSRR